MKAVSVVMVASFCKGANSAALTDCPTASVYIIMGGLNSQLNMSILKLLGSPFIGRVWAL